MNTTHTPEGPGSVSGAPNLPAGFADTFESRYVQVGDVRLHAVVGGDGPPLLLVHGWPETWYAWRLVMPALARDFTVVAVDQRGRGLSDRPAGGYDTGTLADELVALMDALGYDRFALVGHDTGFAISYAIAADHGDRVERAALIDIPGSPGAAPSPPVFVPGFINDRLWHLPFNRLEGINEQLVSGREDIFFRWEFDAAAKPLPDAVIDHYVDGLRDPDALPRASAGTARSTRRWRRTPSGPRRADDAGAGHRRREELRRARCRGHAARRRRRPGPRGPGRRALRGRGSARGAAGRVVRLPRAGRGMTTVPAIAGPRG